LKERNLMRPSCCLCTLCFSSWSSFPVFVKFCMNVK
jgi:hypothetical protein